MTHLTDWMASQTWKCDICREERPDAFISVYKVDITPKNLPPGSVVRNVKYCSDDPACKNGAMNWKEKAL